MLSAVSKSKTIIRDWILIGKLYWNLHDALRSTVQKPRCCYFSSSVSSYHLICLSFEERTKNPSFFVWKFRVFFGAEMPSCQAPRISCPLDSHGDTLSPWGIFQPSPFNSIGGWPRAAWSFAASKKKKGIHFSLLFLFLSFLPFFFFRPIWTSFLQSPLKHANLH